MLKFKDLIFFKYQTYSKTKENIKTIKLFVSNNKNYKYIVLPKKILVIKL